MQFPVRLSPRLGVLLVAVAGASINLAGAEQGGDSAPRLAEAPAATDRPLPFRSFLTSEQITASRGGLSVDRQNRAAVAAFFNAHYTANLSVPIGWTGNVASCDAGATSQAYLDATIDMVNYYRAMVGLPTVTNQIADNVGAQEAALMMSAAGTLTHSPGPTWPCHSDAGADGASSSNLAIGTSGPPAIVAYINDLGSSNYYVGHRRWILFPPRSAMGTGSVPSGPGHSATNALDVFGPTTARPATPVAVTWPPEGFVPYQVVYGRWSFALNTAHQSVDYDIASVTMTHGGSPVSLSVLALFPAPGSPSYRGDDTIVWQPNLGGLGLGPGMTDTTVTVTVSGISHDTTTSMTYDVTIFDPATSVDEIFEDDFESGTTSAWI